MAYFWDRLEALSDRPLTSTERALVLSVAAFAATAAALLLRPSLSLLEIVGIATLVAFVIFLASLTLLRPPTCKRGHVGILVALAPELDSHALRLRSDFLQHLRRLVDRSGSSLRLHVVEYSPRLAKTVADHATAIQAGLRSRCQVVIYGEARLRSVGGTEQHIITPRLMVRHVPIPQAKSLEFGQALDRVFPAQMRIAAEGDFIGLAFASSLVLAAAEYALGIAAVMSLDLDRAEQFLKQAQAEVAHLPSARPPAQNFNRAIQGHLAEIHGLRLVREMGAWGRTRNKAHLTAAEEHVDRVLALRPHSELALQAKAITAFVLRRDVALAKRCINQCSHSDTSTWRYSEAFLCLYEGRLDRARAAYRAAARAPTNEVSDYLQSEQFIADILSEEPERYQLWFGLGAINLLAKEDIDTAAEAFARFRAEDKSNKYGPYHVWAEDQIAQARLTAGR